MICKALALNRVNKDYTDCVLVNFMRTSGYLREQVAIEETRKNNALRSTAPLGIVWLLRAQYVSMNLRKTTPNKDIE